MSSFRGKPHVAPFVGPPWPVATAWLLAALLVQASLAHYAAIHGVVPSFVLVVVVWYAIRVDPLRAAAYGLAAGFAEDALSAQTGAAWTISTTIAATLTSVLSRSFFADSIPLAASATVAATLVRALLFWITMSLEGYPAGLGGMHTREALLAAALNVATIVVAMVVARRFGVRNV